MSSVPPEETVVPPALSQAWHQGKPSAGELQRGYSRYLRRREPKRRAFGFARWVVGGLVLGAGLAQAASVTPWQRWFGQNQVILPTAPSKDRTPPSSQPRPAPAVEAATPTVVVAPSLMAAAGAPQAAPVATPPAASPAAVRAQEQWRLAADGLRTGDFNGANVALLELERTTTAGERDAARLARAQLLSSHGRSAEALTISRELEQRASSSVVRDKARDLRQRLTKISTTDRSPAAAPGINQP